MKRLMVIMFSVFGALMSQEARSNPLMVYQTEALAGDKMVVVWINSFGSPVPDNLDVFRCSGPEAERYLGEVDIAIGGALSDFHWEKLNLKPLTYEPIVDRTAYVDTTVSDG
ncbi:MAG: hypothetical protein V1800_12805, partial [Candidatus Latescibacterota bacterium]